MWTTLEWLRESYRASGVHVPIHVLPLGMENKLTHVAKSKNMSDPFTFLVVANGQERKGIIETIKVPPPVPKVNSAGV